MPSRNALRRSSSAAGPRTAVSGTQPSRACARINRLRRLGSTCRTKKSKWFRQGKAVIRAKLAAQNSPIEKERQQQRPLSQRERDRVRGGTLQSQALTPHPARKRAGLSPRERRSCGAIAAVLPRLLFLLRKAVQ